MANRKRKESTAPAAPAPVVVNALLGRVLDGRYRVDEQLGAGGVGAVYCGVQIALGRPVAIKILHEGVHPSFTQRFEREAKALASLRHPNIVAVTDYGVCDGTPFLVMELLEGETLAYRLMKGRMEPDQVLELARQLLRALSFVHEQGLVHRDLKPGNVFLEKLPGGEERLKLLDFGLAKFVHQAHSDPEEPAVTRAGDIVGTPAYISPEQVAGDTIDARVDTYAMGIMLFQMLSGRVPFEGEPVEQLKSHLVAPVPALRDKHPGLSTRVELESFFQRAMAKSRDARFQNCIEMLAALEAIPRPWLKKIDLNAEPALASTILSTPPPDASLDARTRLHEAGPSETQLVRYARRYGTLLLAVISLSAMALVAALLTHDARMERKAAAAAAGETESKPSNVQPRRPAGAVDDGRHSSAKLASPPAAPASSPALSPGPPAGPAPIPAPTPAPSSTIAPSPSPTPAPSPAPALSPSSSAAPAPTPPAQPLPATTTQPAAATAASAEQPATPQRALARNPWLRAAPKELRSLRSSAVAGERGNDRVFALLRKYNRNNPTDPRGHLLLAHFYMNRQWRNDTLSQYQAAYEVDETARGAPEMLRDLLTLVAHGSVADGAGRLVRAAYGREALPAIDRAIRALTEHGAALARMSALRAAIAGP